MNVEKPPARQCMTCQTAETTKGNECPRCNAISMIKSIIWSHYDGRDALALAETLAKHTMHSFREEARNRQSGAMMRVANAIRDMAYIAEMDDESMRLATVRSIKEHLAHCKKVVEHETSLGQPGAYRQRVAEHIAKWGEEIVWTAQTKEVDKSCQNA